MRSPSEIRRELETLTAQRTELWRELAVAADPAKTSEIARLSSLIESGWDELRATENLMRWGPPEPIVARARAEARLDRELVGITDATARRRSARRARRSASVA